MRPQCPCRETTRLPLPRMSTLPMMSTGHAPPCRQYTLPPPMTTAGIKRLLITPQCHIMPLISTNPSTHPDVLALRPSLPTLPLWPQTTAPQPSHLVLRLRCHILRPSSCSLRTIDISAPRRFPRHESFLRVQDTCEQIPSPLTARSHILTAQSHYHTAPNSRPRPMVMPLQATCRGTPLRTPQLPAPITLSRDSMMCPHWHGILSRETLASPFRL